jgi:hypothetical protein
VFQNRDATLNRDFLWYERVQNKIGPGQCFCTFAGMFSGKIPDTCKKASVSS